MSASLVGFPLGHGYFISISFSFFFFSKCNLYQQAWVVSVCLRCPVWIHLESPPPRNKNTEWGSFDPSDLKADVTWLPTSNGPVNCRESEIIYLWLAFSLVNVNELSTWLPSEPWPWPHGRYIIRLHGGKKIHFCFNFALLRLISDLQIVKLTLERAWGLDQISTRPPCSGLTRSPLNKGAASLKYYNSAPSWIRLHCSVQDVFHFEAAISRTWTCLPFCLKDIYPETDKGGIYGEKSGASGGGGLTAFLLNTRWMRVLQQVLCLLCLWENKSTQAASEGAIKQLFGSEYGLNSIGKRSTVTPRCWE